MKILKFLLMTACIAALVITFTSAIAIVHPGFTPNPVDSISLSINQFTIAFYKNLSESESMDIIFSPLSLSMVMGMIAYGAEDETGNQIKSVLQLPCSPIETELGFRLLSKSLNDLGFRIDNKIFAASNIELKSEFINSTAATFQAEVQNLNFSNVEKSTEIVNNWSKNITRNRIRNVKNYAETSDDSLFFINAVYFKGAWEKEFKPEGTVVETFRDYYSRSREVPIMRMEGTFENGWIEKYKTKFISVPFKSNGQENTVSMYLFAPETREKMDELQANFDKVFYSELKMRISEMSISIPKFSITRSLNLNNVLYKMGMKRMFQESGDFTGFVENTSGSIDKVVQKIFIEVNEMGCEVAVTTGAVSEATSTTDSEGFSVPILFVIAEGVGGTILLSSRIDDPTLGSI